MIKKISNANMKDSHKADIMERTAVADSAKARSIHACRFMPIQIPRILRNCLSTT